ncbi:MAG: hypothetical protein VW124_22110 [Paracoccaceae bacterium]
MKSYKMTKVLWIKFNPWVIGKTGKPRKIPRPSKEIQQFEKLIKISLETLGLPYDVFHEHDRSLSNIRFKDYGVKIKFHGTKETHKCFDLFYMQMHLKNIFQIDPMGWGVSHSSNPSVNKQKITQISKKDLLNLNQNIERVRNGHTKFPQSPPKFALQSFNKPRQGFIFAPLQTPNDTVIKNHSPVSVVDSIKLISEMAKNEEKDVVFKLHPSTYRHRQLNFEIIKLLLTNKNVYLSKQPILKLIEEACYVTTINSGVGFESLLLGKPVVLLGDADYDLLAYKFRGDNTDLHDYLNDFYLPKNKILRKNFLGHYISNHCYDVSAKQLEKSQIDRLMNLVKAQL